MWGLIYKFLFGGPDLFHIIYSVLPNFGQSEPRTFPLVSWVSPRVTPIFDIPHPYLTLG